MMESKYLQMLGRAVRNICVDDKEALTNEEVGLIIYQSKKELNAIFKRWKKYQCVMQEIKLMEKEK